MVLLTRRSALLFASFFALAAIASAVPPVGLPLPTPTGTTTTVTTTTVTTTRETEKATCTVQTVDDGPDVYVLSGVSADPFDCMAVVNDDPPLSPKEVISDHGLTQQVCDLQKKPKVTSYTKSLVETNEKCKWECRPSSLRCVETPDDGARECDCVDTGPRPAIVPLSDDFFVQSATGNSVVRRNSCDKKNEGDVIGLEENCQAISKDTPEKTLQILQRDFPIPGANICSYQPNPKADETYTVYTKMLAGSTGQACNYVCKPDNTLKCGSEDLNDNEQCMCSTSTELVPKLVPIHDEGVTRLIVHEDGSKSFNAEGGCFVRNGVDSCGDCGKCIESTGTCVLKEPELYEKNVCPCGFVCPRDAVIASRPAGSHGSPIMCEVNEALSKEPCSGNGTERPDMCLESGESDLEDQCVCAKTHREVLGLEEEVGNNRCVPIE